MKIKSMAVLVVGATFLIIGCQNPKTASKETFRIALNKYHEANPLVLTALFLHLPILEAEPQFKTNKGFVEFFASVGYLEGRDTVMAVDSQILSPHGLSQSVKVKRATKCWNLTEEGKRNYTSTKNPMFGNIYGFKWADVTVKEVNSFSEPADMMGKRVSEAIYSVDIVNQKPWVSKIQDKSDYAIQFSVLKDPARPYKAVLVLTSEGWVDGRISQ